MRQEKKDTKPSFEAKLDAYAARRGARPVDWTVQSRRWPVYAAATGAALAMTTSAEASSIVSGFSGQRISILGYAFDGVSEAATQVNLGGLGHINLQLFTSHSFDGPVIYSHRGTARIFANSGTQVNAKSGLLSRFSSGRAITNGMARSNQGDLDFHLFRTFFSQHILLTSDNFGQWPSNKTGFAGFKLANGDLGWIQLGWSGNGVLPTSLTALYWEVNTTPGAPITAEPPSPAVPEPGTLGLALLAAGAAGVTALRKLRRAKA